VRDDQNLSGFYGSKNQKQNALPQGWKGTSKVGKVPGNRGRWERPPSDPPVAFGKNESCDGKKVMIWVPVEGKEETSAPRSPPKAEKKEMKERK